LFVDDENKTCTLRFEASLPDRCVLGRIPADPPVAQERMEDQGMPLPFSLDPPGDASAAGSRDFEFLIGRWVVAHRRLRRRLEGDTHWDRFGGRCEMRPLLGGLGNIDDNVIELPGGTYRGAALRLFDPAAARWSIWWADSRTPGLQPPVHGRFENGVGIFFGDDTLRGAPIRVRFIWSDITPTAARWTQAFSPDAGATWEENWIMEFTRAD
jgi:hypothetical protein